MSWFARFLPLLALGSAPLSAYAVTFNGGDWGGADLAPADGDVLDGVFTNVREFRIAAGTTVYVEPGVQLEIQCEDALINGTLDGVGAGELGGIGAIGAVGGFVDGTDGQGLGPGGFGTGGDCTYAGGGGGGAYGGQGGNGAHVYGSIGPGGLSYGVSGAPFSAPVDRPFGSGGGGGGAACAGSDGGAGGTGGGSVYIHATNQIQMLGGVIDVRGTSGVDGIDFGGGGGGGAGGSIVLAANSLLGTGQLIAIGGGGGNTSTSVTGGIAGGGGGGGGGRVRTFAGLLQPFSVSTAGGIPGVNQGVGFSATQGLPGTNYHEHADLDGDGILEQFDNCSAVPNPTQADSNFNGVGDACDPCGAYPDTDVDGVCDSVDACPGFDDFDDEDADTVPDGCDACPGGDDFLDTDGDTVADFCDICPGYDDFYDTDGDSIADQCDQCPGFDDLADNDGDLIPNDCDDCPDGNDNDDADGDGVPDLCDVCPAGDDFEDSDGDGIASACDLCPDNWDPDQIDNDGDGWGVACECDDIDDDVYPGGVEVCDNDDNDCNGVVDDDPIDGRLWYRDLDGDGDGSPEDTINACLPPDGYVQSDTDCDDTDPHVRGTGYEVCDGIDNDCDGEIDEIECNIPDPTTDGDGDGDTTGCGCQTDPGAPALGWLALVGVIAMRRRNA